MSQENVELVGRFHALRSGENLVPLIGEIVEQLGPDPQPDAILAFWAQDPSWRHVHPDIEWHASAAGEGRVARGAIEVAGWWREGIEVWESYVFRPLEYRDLGDWVLAAVEAQARGREGIELELRVFELYQVRGGKIVAHVSSFSEREALEAVGLGE
jgi:hypothetical protein